MLHGSCVSERPACSRSVGGLAASAAVPGAAEQVTSLAPVERSAHNIAHAQYYANEGFKTCGSVAGLIAKFRRSCDSLILQLLTVIL